jgi:hypothetical protein
VITTRPRVRATSVTLVLLLAAAWLAAMAPAPAEAAPATAPRTPVMARERLSPTQLAAWFRANPTRVAGYRASVPVEELTRLFVEEGRFEGVAGDLAFAQSVLETGSFRFPDHGQVRAEFNNFGGIGACDGGTCGVGRFPSARIGVRAQIHHLRAYADPSVTRASLANPLESPRFDLVVPKGRAPYWEQYGNGNWATDPAYATKILGLYAQMLAHAGVSPTDPVPAFTDLVPGSVHVPAIEAIAARGVTSGCTPTTFCPDQHVTRAQMATFLQRSHQVPPATGSRFGDVSGVHAPAVEAIAAAGITHGCAPGRYCPGRLVTRAEMASLLARASGVAPRPATFADVPAASSHAGAIGALAAAGVVEGRGDGTFGPDLPVTRAQMASFLDRAHRLLR